MGQDIGPVHRRRTGSEPWERRDTNTGYGPREQAEFAHLSGEAG